MSKKGLSQAEIVTGLALAWMLGVIVGTARERKKLIRLQ